MTDKPVEYPKEFLDVFKVLDFGAKKYSPNGWLEGKNFDSYSNFKSICGHGGEVYSGKTRDDESGLHPALHGACRLLMEYTIWKRKNKDRCLY